MTDRATWWILRNAHDEFFVSYGRTEEEARGNCVARIFAPPGDLVVLAGGLTNEEANTAHEAWNEGDRGPADRLHARYLGHDDE